MIEALIFDVDGTLAETEELHRRAFNEAFAAAGLPWAWDPALYARLLAVAGGKERVAAFVARHGGRPALDAAAIAALHAEKTRRYMALAAAGALVLRPGVARLINEATVASRRLAIATTTSPANISSLLRVTLGLTGPERFAVIAAGDEVPAKKPAPDIYELALARLGLPAGTCVALEDSANGVLAARAAGLPVLVTRSLYTADDDVAGAFAVLDQLGEPGRPCRTEAGAAPPHGFVDLAYLDRWAGAEPG